MDNKIEHHFVVYIYVVKQFTDTRLRKVKGCDNSIYNFNTDKQDW